MASSGKNKMGLAPSSRINRVSSRTVARKGKPNVEKGDCRILLVPVGSDPVEKIIPNDWEAFEEAIDGRFFAQMPVGPGVVLVAAEDYHGLTPNGCGMYGAYFFKAATGNLTDEQIRKCRSYWEALKAKAPPGPEDMKVKVFELGSPEAEAYGDRERAEREKAVKFWQSL